MRAAPAQTTPKTFGDVLRELRLATGLSQEALAELAHMSSGGISVLERGTRRAPHRNTVTLLADALDLSSGDRTRFEQAAYRAGVARRRGKMAATPVLETGNLPYALTSFIGRENSSNSVRDHVLDYRLVTLTGAGGVGKTRLAIETAHELGGEFPDGIWFVELAAIHDQSLVAPRVAATVGLSVEATASDSGWIEEIAERHMLLVLDNCEHVLTACASMVQRVLQISANLHILATSREPLHINGERVVRLGPLREGQAIQLFIDRARNANPDFDASGDGEVGMEQIREICRRLNGIPLALELAAARVSSLSLKAIADNVLAHFSLPGAHERGAANRHQTMRGLIDWSYDLLTEPERRTFERLAIFSGGANLSEAAAVCANGSISETNVPYLLSSLVDKSLVIVDLQIDEARYGLLEITRNYALEKLQHERHYERTARQHAVTFLEVASRLEHRESMPDAAWRARVQMELENWRAVLHWALEQRHDVELAQRLAATLWQVWMFFATAEGRRWCRAALDAAGPATPPELLAKLRYTEALFAVRAGEFDSAFAISSSLIPEYRRLKDQVGLAGAQKVAGSALVYLGRVSEGEPLLEQALENARSAGNLLLLASVEDSIAAARSEAGDFPAAKAHFERVYEFYNAAGSERDALYATVGLAEATFRAGDPGQAVQLLTRAIERSRALDDQYLVAASLSNLSNYLLNLNRFGEALAVAREAVDLCARLHFEIWLAWAIANVAAARVLGSEDSRQMENSGTDRFAKLFGFVRARLQHLKAPPDPPFEREIARAMNIVEQRLGSEKAGALMDAGSLMTPAAALSLVT